MRKITSIAAAGAVVLTSIGLAATPAEARGRHGGYSHGGWGYRHHDRIDAGDVIGGLLVIGAIAAIATAASKDNRDRRDRDRRYDPPYPDQDRRDAPYYRPQDGGDAYSGAARSEAEARAADACSWAVEGEMGDDARVDRITGTRRDGNGWYVTGTASRLSGDVRDFDCSYRNGRVVDVRFR